MTPESAIHIVQQGLQVAALISAPVLLTMLIVGVIVGMIQAATSINEMTLSFIPKLLGLCFVLGLSGNWMIKVFVAYARETILNIPSLIG